MSSSDIEHEQNNVTDKSAESGSAASAEESAESSLDETGELTVEEQLKQAFKERDEHFDKLLRTQADLENYRRRIQKDLEEARKYQALGLARDLLPGLDNLSRAVEAAANSDKIDDLVTGVKMVLSQLEGILASHAVQPISAVGESFDPNFHEAIQQVSSEDHPPMTILQEVEKGYQLHDRVVRPSKVIVSSGPATQSKEE